MSLHPRVSVIIPTFNRPQLLERAIASVLNQTWQDLEIIVIVDGPDSSTQAMLKQFRDPRLRVLINSENQGCSGSRIRGIRAARGAWIAYLDDDDAWMPEKLERQITLAEQFNQSNSDHHLVVSCRCKVLFDQHEEIWPRRLPQANEPIAEYLFVRNEGFQGEGLMQMSTLLIPKTLYAKIPLVETSGKHDDWNLILQLSQVPGVCFKFVDAPLAQWNLKTYYSHTSDPDRNRWQNSRAWLRQRRALVTRRAYAAFLLTEVAARAAAKADWSAVGSLLFEAFKIGQPTAKMLLLYAAMWLFPSPVRQQLRRWKRHLFFRRMRSHSPVPLSPTSTSSSTSRLKSEAVCR